MLLQRYQPNLFDIHWNKMWIRFSYQVPVWKANEFPSRHRLVKGETSHHWMRSTWMSYRENAGRENEVWGFVGIEQTKRYQQEGGSNHKLKKLDQIGIRPKKIMRNILRRTTRSVYMTSPTQNSIIQMGCFANNGLNFQPISIMEIAQPPQKGFHKPE